MSTENKDYNPYAFPKVDFSDRGILSKHNPGMTLRDYFANSAMQGLLSSYVGSSDVYKDISYNAKLIASHSYHLADEMLKQRELTSK